MFKLFNDDYKNALGKFPDGTVDLVVTDPPYLHVKGGMKSKKYNVGTWKDGSQMTATMSDFDKDKIYEFLDLTIPKMKKVNMYIFCSKLQLQYYFSYIVEHKKLKYDLLIWDKVKYSMKSTKFHTSDIEYVIRIYQPGVSLKKVLIEDGSKSDIDFYLKRQAHEQPRNKRHETEKPLKLIERYILTSSEVGDIVLDPFMGSGTTGEASVLNGRNFIGIEMEEKHFDTSNERLKEVSECLN